MDHHQSPTSRLTARLIMALLGLAAMAGIALAGYLAFAAIPDSAWHTPRTPSIHDPASPYTRVLNDQYWIVFWLSAIVFVVVEGMILWGALRFRRKEGDGEPDQVHGNNTLEVLWTLGPVLLVLYLAYMSYGTMRQNFVSREAMAGGAEILEIEAIGMQWWWAFQYPEGFETATEMVVPVGRPVRVNVDSTDVLHSFWVPELAGKVDAVPGERDGGFGQNFIWFVAERTGRFEGQCAELCGTQHAGMRFSVTVVEADEYAAWAGAMAEVPAEPPEFAEAFAIENDSDAELPAAMDTAEYRGWKTVGSTCMACHNVDGHSLIPVVAEDAPRKFGPNLTRVATRSQLAGGVFTHTSDNARAWIQEPESRKIGSLMTNMGIQADGSADILAYLNSMKIDDEIMRPIFASDPPASAIPPAYPGLQHLLDTPAEGEEAEEQAVGPEAEVDAQLESRR